MKVCFKNFLRNNLVNLTIKSIRHFIPNAEIYCLCQYKESPDEYDNLEKLDIPESNIFYEKSKYTNLGPSVANQYNNLFFSEGYNQIWQKFKNYNGKLLMLAEDHFFTTGQTLKELQEKNFNLAYAKWGNGMNGSLLCCIPTESNFFPIPELYENVEHTFKRDIVNKSTRSYELTTRDETNYKGDGIYSNDYQEIRKCLIDAKIIQDV